MPKTILIEIFQLEDSLYLYYECCGHITYVYKRGLSHLFR